MTVDATKLLKIGQVSTDSTKTSGGAPVDVNMTKNGSIFNCKNPNNNGSSNGIAKAASSGSGGNWLSRLFGATSDCSANDDVNKTNVANTQKATNEAIVAGAQLQADSKNTIAVINKNDKIEDKLNKKIEKDNDKITELSKERDSLVEEQEASVSDSQVSSEDAPSQKTSPAINPFASNSTNGEQEAGGSGLLTTNTPAATNSPETKAPTDNSSKITALNGKIENRASSVKSNTAQMKTAKTQTKTTSLNFQKRAASTKTTTTAAANAATSGMQTADVVGLAGQGVTVLGGTASAVGAAMTLNPTTTPLGLQIVAGGAIAGAAGSATSLGAQVAKGDTQGSLAAAQGTAAASEGAVGKVKEAKAK